MKFVDYEGERTFYINGIGNPGSGPTPEGIKMHKYYNFTNKGLIKDFKILGGHKNAKMFNGIDLKGVITTSIEMMNVYIYSRSLSQYILSNIKNYPLDKGEELNIISYSGGGQIALNIAEQLKGKIHFNNIVLIGSPVIQKDFSNIDKIYYLYGNNDRVVKHSNYLNIIKNDNQIKKINLGNLDHNDYFHNDHIFNVLETIGNCIN